MGRFATGHDEAERQRHRSNGYQFDHFYWHNGRKHCRWVEGYQSGPTAAQRVSQW
jgi:hypothetical protein